MNFVVYAKDKGPSPEAVRKARQGRIDVSVNQTVTYYFDINKCKVCPLRDGCYKPGAKSKSYSVSIKSDEHSN